MPNPGIIICSRTDSKRIHKKPLAIINGQTLIGLLVSRVMRSGLPVYLAVPREQADEYKYLKRMCPEIRFFYGHADDPLKRMNCCAIDNAIDPIIRITHDKIFVDPDMINNFIEEHLRFNAEYSYSSDFIDGTGFEIISKRILGVAADKFERCEHISYAVKACATNVAKIALDKSHGITARLLVDYEEDIELIENILQRLGNDCSQQQVISFLKKNPWMSSINRLPIATVYTCAYNAEDWIERAMYSVADQIGFDHFQYVLVDDFSTDSTFQKMSRFKLERGAHVKVLRNPCNLGLASASNCAIKSSVGKYVVRLDADDFFTNQKAVMDLLHFAGEHEADIVYPSFFDERTGGRVVDGSLNHHVGGALFSRRAINDIMFTDGLRGWDGLDLFLRAKDRLKIAYLRSPLFWYTDNKKSLSNSNAEARHRVKEDILRKHGDGKKISDN